jgi:hypothetical protein
LVETDVENDHSTVEENRGRRELGASAAGYLPRRAAVDLVVHRLQAVAVAVPHPEHRAVLLVERRGADGVVRNHVVGFLLLPVEAIIGRRGRGHERHDDDGRDGRHRGVSDFSHRIPLRIRDEFSASRY